MNRERTQGLWAKALAGEPLATGEEAELLGSLRADPDLRRELLRDAKLHGMMGAVLQGDGAAEAGVRQFLERVAAEKEATGFIRKVESRIAGGGSDPGSGGPPRPSAPTARPTRRWPNRKGEGGHPGYLPAMLIAAGLLFGAIVYFSVSSPDPDPTEPRKAAAARRERAKEQESRRKKAEEERARAERERTDAEERLAKLRAEEKRAEEARIAASAAKEESVREKAEEAFAEALRKRKAEEERLVALRETEKRAEEAKQALATPAAEPERPEKQGTEAAAARVEQAAAAVSSNGSAPLKAGDSLLEGQGVVVAAGGRAVLVFADSTRLELGSDTEIRALRVEGGKRLRVERGTIRAEVIPQPAGRPMIFDTRDGQATVLGTTLRLVVDPDAARGTRLEVEKGKVELKNLAGKSVLVVTGHYAVAAVGAEPVARPIVPETAAAKLLLERGQLTISFGPEGRTVPDGVLIDSGEEFDARRGFGWSGPKVGAEIPGAYSINADGSKFYPKKGRKPVTRTGSELRASSVMAGWANHVEKWKIALPNGRYHVTVCAGDKGAGQGPHHVSIEGFQLIDAVMTQKDFVEQSVLLSVTDGELTMSVGGCGAVRISKDNSSDTQVNYIVIRKVPDKK